MHILFRVVLLHFCATLVMIGLGCDAKKIEKKEHDLRKKKLTPVSKKIVQKSKPTTQTSTLRDDENARGLALYTEGMKTLKTSPQKARRLLYQSTKLAPKHGPTHLALANVSQQLGNDSGAFVAAFESLRHVKTNTQRTQALTVLRETASSQTNSKPWHVSSFLETHIIYNALDNLPKKGLSKKRITAIKAAYHSRAKGCQMQPSSLVFESPAALCKAKAQGAQCDWSGKPKLTSAPQSITMTITRDKVMEVYLVMGKKRKWYSVLMSSKNISLDGKTHESIKTNLFPPVRTTHGPAYFKAAVEKRRGQSKKDMFEEEKQVDMIWCRWDASFKCARQSVKNQRMTYAIVSDKKGQSNHVLLSKFGPATPMDWANGLPNRPACLNH